MARTKQTARKSSGGALRIDSRAAPIPEPLPKKTSSKRTQKTADVDANPASSEIHIPELPASHAQFLEYLGAHSETPILELVEPYTQYDTEMRKVFAQKPDHPAAQELSIVPVFGGFENNVKIRARNLQAESEKEKESYIMPLEDDQRKANDSPAIVQSLKDFRTNFNLFSESALVDLNWSNVVAAGSSVVTSLLAVPDEYSGSKRALRDYYHEKLAPASDVDLFLYGLTEDEATEKIKRIEQQIRDSILAETTTIRTKNAITIASQYPTRHVQIVLRIYKSISEILTGFDVDCSCVAYNGKQVYASPRAIAAYMTQINTIDLTRRSPSYESRLSKYAHRGFEVFWPGLDRSRIDPTIFERSFGRTEGLARLLILEKLPKSSDRDAYLDQRRAERGRPSVSRWRMNRRMIHGNIKNDYEDEVAEWVDAEEVSDYHTFTIPYGKMFYARKIEKLLYTKDLLLNAEWNKPKDREVNLHRHPAFFGRAEDVFRDCCGSCPKPSTIEEEEAAEEEGKVYISGDIKFIKDDAGRQAIGSFNPLTADDWTEMAYVGNTELLCKAIVDGDAEYVRSWLQQDGNDPNTRDYCGRTPLTLAVSNSTLEIVQLLIDNGARLVARLVDGRTALHLAAMRGNVDMVSALLRKSEANEEEEDKKLEAKRAARAMSNESHGLDMAMKDTSISQDDSEKSEEGSDVDMVDDSEDDHDMDATTENSMIKIKLPASEADDKALAGDDDDEPDVYDVNVLAWDTAASPLHLAIVSGHVDVVKTLVGEFGADVLLPIKLFNDHDKSAKDAILTLVLALQLPIEEAKQMTRTLIELGATVAQADLKQTTVLQYSIADNKPDMLETLVDADKTGTGRAINHLSVSGYQWRPETASALMTAIKARDGLTALRLLTLGANPEIDFSSYIKAYQAKFELQNDSSHNKKEFEKQVEQPVINAVHCELPDIAKTLIEQHKTDPNTLATTGWALVHSEYRGYNKGLSLLDEVRQKIKELKDWKPKEEEFNAPIPLQDRDTYFSGLQEGSYSWWSTEKQIKSAQKSYNQDLKTYEDNVKRAKDHTGIPEKKIAIQNLQKQFEELESILLEKGAKTFKELYPHIEEPDERNHHYYHSYRAQKPKPFEVKFHFRLGNLTDETRERYLKLFEAAWRADLQTIKQLTLVAWKNSSGEDQPPLTIAVQDQHGLSVFAVAVLQCQFDLATAIMEIAQAQYAEPDAPKAQRYGVDGGAEDDDASDLGDEVRLYSEIVDDQFTVESIGEVSTQVKSHILPTTMLEWHYPVSDFMAGPLRSSPSSSTGFSYFGPRRQHTMVGKRTNTGSLKAASNHLSDEKRAEAGKPANLIQFALHNDDQDLLIYLLSLGQDLARANKDDDGIPRYFSISGNDYLVAIQLDRPHLLSELIKRTGAGIPINGLVKKSGVEIKEKPKYYVGLTVYGQKRKDWADAGRNTSTYQVVESHRPGLLEAARWQSLETVEWFLGDGPMRCYKEFAAARKDDQRIKTLSETKGGFEASVSKFLNARSSLAIHCCIMGRPMPETMPLLKFLIKTLPESVNTKSSEGRTPLQLAFWNYREEAAKVLIEAGADQTSRDKYGNNLVHSVLRRPVSNRKKLETLPRMLDLIDKRLLSDMFIERSAEDPGSLTPLAQWEKQMINNSGVYNHPNGDEVLRIILHYSQGSELALINGEGHTPLHVAVRECNLTLAQTLLEADPTLLMRENATGRTPYELAEDAAIASVCSGPPPLPWEYSYNDHRARRQGLLSSWNQNIVSRSPEDFVKEPSSDQRIQREKVFDLLREVRAHLESEGQSKRRLVTLNEANEVARRLALNKSGQHGRRNRIKEYRRELAEERQREEDEAYGGDADEVQLWLPFARSWIEDDEETSASGPANSHGGFFQQQARRSWLAAKSVGGKAPRKQLVSRK